MNLIKRVGRRRSEKPVLDGDEFLVVVVAEDETAASAADLAEVRAIVPPPAVADVALLEELSSFAAASDSVVFSASSSSLAIRWIVESLANEYSSLYLLLLQVIVRMFGQLLDCNNS